MRGMHQSSVGSFLRSASFATWPNCSVLSVDGIRLQSILLLFLQLEP